MEKSELISIIVPVYNVEKYIEECVNSIINQTYKNIEIILVDDGSQDKSGVLCEKLAQKDTRIRVVHKKNGGLADARNVGVCNSRGDYIAFIDADDYVDTTMYENLLNACQKYDVALACARWKSFGNKFNDLKSESGSEIEMTSEEYLQNMIWEKKKYFITTSVCTCLFKRKILEGLSFPKGKYYEDIVYCTQAVINAEKCIYIDKALYFYRIRENSISDVTRKKGIDINKYNDQLEQEIKQIQILEKEGWHKLASYIKYVVYKECLRYYAISAHNKEMVLPYIVMWKEDAARQVKREKKLDNKIRVKLSFYSLNLYRILDRTWLHLRGKAQ